MNFRRLTVLLVLFLALPLSALDFIAPKKTNEQLKRISALTISYYSRQHYAAAPLNANKTEIAFRSYLKLVDPAKMYLTEFDVEEFSLNKADFPRLFGSGNLAIPFGLFNRMLNRFDLFCAYAHKLLDKGVPDGFMNSQETFVADRMDVPREKDLTALYGLWHKRLVNDLILLELSDRSAAERKKKQTDKDAEADIDPAPIGTPSERLLKRIDQLHRIYEEMEPIEVLELFLCAVGTAYDPHTAYMTPVSDEDFNIDMSLKLIGIGAVLQSEDGYTKIVEVIPGGPADKDGRLQPGDRIIAVAQEGKDSVDIINMPLNKVVRKIRGRENTKVTLTVLTAKNGLNSVPVKYTLTRAEVIVREHEARGEIRNVKNANGVERKLGVIVLPSFYMDFDAARKGNPNYKRASLDVKNILLDFQKQNVEGVVIDLRGNGGGSLPDAVTLSGLFIPEGPVVQVRSSAETESYNDPDGGKVAYAGPMAVLVNRLSASASEIFAGAMQDYGRAVVVGDAKTHGKGSVQSLNSLDPLMMFLTGERSKVGSVKITCAKFYRVNGASTQLKGVVPDIVFPSFFDSLDMGEDKLDNPLPWDTISCAKYAPWSDAASLSKALPQLSERSRKRMAETAGFQRLVSDIARFETMRKKKECSLNLEERWKEFQEMEKIAEEQDKMSNPEGQTNAKKLKNGKKKNNGPDLYLDETLNILNDWIDLRGK